MFRLPLPLPPSHRTAARTTKARPNRRRTLAQLESLEGRQLLTLSGSTLVPDSVSLPQTEGGVLVPTSNGYDFSESNYTNPKIEACDLAPMQNTVVSGILPATLVGGQIAYSDNFSVYLTKGQVLKANLDVQYTYGESTGVATIPIETGHHDGKIQVKDPNGSYIATSSTYGLSNTSDAGTTADDANVIFTADATGYYYFSLHTDQGEADPGMAKISDTGISYIADLMPIGMSTVSDSQLDPNNSLYSEAEKQLNFTGGGMYTFLTTTTDTSDAIVGTSAATQSNLSFVGPTGRGFQLQSNWSESVAADGTITYTSSGTVKIEANGFNGKPLAIPLSLPSGVALTVTTTADTQTGGYYGQVASTGLSVDSFSIGSLVQQAKSAVNNLSFNLDGALSQLGTGTFPSASFGIELGDALSNSSNPSLSEAPTNPAIPYIYFGASANIGASMNGHVGLGNVSLSLDKTAKSFGVIVDPADPSIYLDVQGLPAVDDFAAEVSLNAMIPDAATPGGAGDGTEFYGDIYTKAELNLGDVSDIPVIIDGSITVNLDPVQNLGLVNAVKKYGNDLRYALDFKQDGRSQQLKQFAQDLNNIEIGVNGTLNMGYDKGGISVSFPVADASILWIGTQEQGDQTVAVDTLAFSGSISTFNGTLASYLDNETDSISGWVQLSTGDFSVSLTAAENLFGQQVASGTVTVTNSSITLEGEVDLSLDWSYDGYGATGGVDVDATVTIYYSGLLSASFSGDVYGSLTASGTNIGTFDESTSYSTICNFHSVPSDIWNSVEDQAKSDAEAVFNTMDQVYQESKSEVLDAWDQVVSSTESWTDDAKNWFESW